MRRYFSIVALGVFAVAQVAACSSDDESTPSTPTAGAAGKGGSAGSAGKGGSGTTGGSGGSTSSGGSGGSAGTSQGGAGGSTSSVCEDYCEKLSGLKCSKQSECVARCKAAEGAVSSCPTEAKAVSDCYMAKPLTDFECNSGGHPVPKAGTCKTEGDALGACLAAQGGAGGQSGASGAGGVSAGGASGAAGSSAGSAGAGGSAPACTKLCPPKGDVDYVCVITDTGEQCKLKDGEECETAAECASGKCPDSLKICISADPGTCVGEPCKAPAEGACEPANPKPQSEKCGIGYDPVPACTLDVKASTCTASCTCKAPS